MSASAPPPAHPPLPANQSDPAVPYYIFPPFPEAPPGVTLIPFDKFEAKGIYISIGKKPKATAADEGDNSSSSGEEEDIETDALGIPTTDLESTHSAVVGPAVGDTQVHKMGGRKKKAQRSQRKQVISLAGTPVRVQTWYEKWEEEERHIGRRGFSYNPREDRADRLHCAVQAFRKGRSLDPSVQSIWDKFLNFTGLQRHDQPILSANGGGRYKARKQSSYEDSFSDDEDDDDDVNKPEEEFDEVEERFMSFLNDIEESMKVFLSSEYHRQGLCWTEAKLRDGPILISFFLDYLLKERVLPEPEYERGLKKALTFVNTVAKVVLPATKPFSHALADEFSRACVQDLGVLVLLTGYGWRPAEEVQAELDRQYEARMAEMERHKAEEAKQLQLQMEQTGMATIDVSTLADGWGGPMDATWDDAQDAGWGAPQATGEPWGAARLPTLFKFLGPTSLPLTHSLLRCEESVRAVRSCTPPDPEHPDLLRRQFAVLTLRPWTLPESGVKEGDLVKPPVLLRTAEGEREKAVMRMPGGGHKLSDDIEVLLSPHLVEFCLLGLGVGGVFVQVGRTSTMETVAESKDADQEKSTVEKKDKEETKGKDEKKEKEETKGKDEKKEKEETKGKDEKKDEGKPAWTKGKKKGKGGGPKERAETFWFIQNVMFTLSSYWIEKN